MDSTFKSITRDRRNDLFSQCRVDMNPAGLPLRTWIVTWEVPSGIYALHCLNCTTKGRAAKTHVVPNEFANPLASTFCLPYIYIYIYICIYCIYYIYYIYNHSLVSLSTIWLQRMCVRDCLFVAFRCELDQIICLSSVECFVSISFALAVSY